MVEKVLSAKPLTIFFLTFGIVFLNNLLFQPTQAIFKIISLIHIIFLPIWLWSIAIGLQRFIVKNHQMDTLKFKRIFFILVVIGLYTVLFEPNLKMNAFDDRGMFGTMMSLFLLELLCGLYLISFTAKTIKTVELQRTLKFSDYMIEFFLIVFYPFGIWKIQPRVKKIFQINEKHAAQH
jgi:uncharacterized membrane protein